ncbi:MAG: alkaline phosphatase [Phycisphaerae bacterium]|nr:alkaline phosphatase [Phycisphaerae bacterium]
MRKTQTILLSVFVSLIFLVSGALGQTPKYIILFIGDGMGANHRILAEKVSEVKGLGKLEMNHLPVRGEAKTNCLDQEGRATETTDSAAAATALACGVKTGRGMLGMKQNHTPGDNFTDDAQKAGWKVGIITTDWLNGATPGGFYAHTKSRHMYDEILKQAAKSDVDFFAGRGFKGKDVDKILREGGYNVVKGKIDSANPPKMPCANLEMGSMADTLQAALAMLENPKGFFIMLESSHIDGHSHGNFFAGAINETISMNDAVRVALDFQKKHPNDTLIITTADHECGGLTIVDKNLDPRGLLKVKNPRDVEKIIVNDVVAFKPSDEELITNIKDAIELEDISQKDQKILIDLYRKKKIKGDDGLVREVVRLMNEQAGITWTSGGHTSDPVPTTAVGVGSEAFKGKYENTHIADAIRGFIQQSVKK